ncbi:hypothetical protein RJZ56_008209 [Blastomyces dermatitidis]
MLASASDDHTVQLWDTAMSTAKQTLKGHTNSVNAVAFSPNGQILTSASDDHTIRLWDTVMGAAKQTLEGHTDWVNGVAFSPNGQMLASASIDRTVRLWDAATGAVINIISHDVAFVTLSFSDDGRYLNAGRGSVFSILNSSKLVHTMDSGIGLLVHEKWITRNGQNLIWLPPERRAICVAINDDNVALGHKSGHVTWLKFNPP